MARPQSFDQQQALTDAMRLFWQQGYASTSIRELTKATGLQPGSLYAAFKNKRQLFLLALDHYFTELQSGVTALLRSPASPLERIRHFFDYLLKQTQDDGEMKGCLLVNTLLETPSDDAEINQRVAAMLLRIEREFCRVLQQAKDNGELAADKNPQALAQFLMAGIFGLRVYNRMQADAYAMRDIVDNLLSVLWAGREN
jgi:TetR/AcrR family transcriptional repressor of nem operon